VVQTDQEAAPEQEVWSEEPGWSLLGLLTQDTEAAGGLLLLAMVGCCYWTQHNQNCCVALAMCCVLIQCPNCCCNLNCKNLCLAFDFVGVSWDDRKQNVTGQHH